MLVGLWVLVRHRWRDVGWVVLLLLAGNWLAGVFSVSQEGAPYVYRTAATMIPAFLMVGIGAQAVDGSGVRRAALPILLTVAFAWNLYAYFGLEARNVLAARVMAYELRLLADEVRATDHPVFLVGAETLAKRQPLERVASDLRPPYFDRNPTFRFGTGYSLRAVELLSGRHQSSLPAPILLQIDDLARLRSNDPVVLLFRPGGAGEVAIRRLFPAAELRFIGDVRGPPALGVVTLSGVD
jgi:hypothetical protein